ncbi:3-phenylpropionate/trans-cinnamate dioxygenase ferredoxin subunit [Arcanobacterium phocae]|uniref:3-phenylpropionate/trans-cinnamate dioxygenase ferredoxin subunit n=1 Tax=Arcanobacterium phocae TaxID=131112 RepID=A0A1H2LI89_9ACTO|nr:non-heme iron oxygenase ferredoxin subunit [Arcanobacterium phocae]SDU80773.1 3-phenylpropionate/trans-cinnamate dioxygenase ferredoxin subunit [Arcanobacterium phocae]
MSDHRVCAVSDVAPGSVAGFEIVIDDVETIPIAVIHAESGSWFATHDRCTHGRVKLSEGWVEDETIECSRHGAAFDLASGQVLTPPASAPITTYPVRVDGDDVYITVQS